MTALFASLRAKLLGLPKHPPIQVTIYSRAGCHLCEEAKAMISSMRSRYQIVLDEVDVDSRPELEAQHGKCVPVIYIAGKLRFRGRPNPVLLRRALDAASTRSF